VASAKWQWQRNNNSNIIDLHPWKKGEKVGEKRGKTRSVWWHCKHSSSPLHPLLACLKLLSLNWKCKEQQKQGHRKKIKVIRVIFKKKPSWVLNYSIWFYISLWKYYSSYKSLSLNIVFLNNFFIFSVDQRQKLVAVDLTRTTIPDLVYI